MAIPSVGGGYQVGDGNQNEVILNSQVAPDSIAAGNATLTAANLAKGLILGNPGAAAAAYTLPTGALMDAYFTNAKVNSSFDFSVINVDGNTSGVITMTAGTGWTIVGLATIAAVAGTTHAYRVRKTGTATYTLYTLA